MSTPKVRTKPDLSIDSPIHQAAIAAGDDHFRSWQHAVIDKFKPLTVEEIRAELAATAHPFAVCCENLIGDFNFATMIRNANAFNAKEVFYLGNRKFDRRGSVGAYIYIKTTWLATMDDFIKLKDKYTIIGVDNIDNRSIPLANYKWNPNTLLVFGSEGVGLTPGMQELCEDVVAIQQFGSVRSLNVGVASGIVMHDFVSRFPR